MKEIKLTQQKVSLVDDEDYEFLNQWKWCAAKSKSGLFYAVRKFRTDGNQTTILMHRVIMGVLDKKVLVDHQDMDGLNNQRYNLRIATYSQNNANRSSRKDSSSKYLGVDRHKGKWRVKIGKNGKCYHVGMFSNEDDAALAYNEAALKHHGEFANLNEFETKIS